MKINKQINLFLRYRLLNRYIVKIKQELESIATKEGKFYERKKQIDENALLKWDLEVSKIVDEWNHKVFYSIDDFPIIKKEEILNYYNNPKRKNDRNPFLEYYK